MALPKPVTDLAYEFADTPQTGGTLQVADGVHWLRMPLPFALSHINLWLLEDGDDWVIVDTGLHVEESTAIWESSLRGLMGGRKVSRIFVTHMHPDHAGNAGWLQQKTGAEFLMSRQEYLFCRMLTADTGRTAPEEAISFYRAAGFAEEDLGHYQKVFGMFGKYIAPLPDSYSRLQHGESHRIGNRSWQVLVGSGHSPEHACLFNHDLNVLISGDQLLPTISSNVGVWPTEPKANPLQDWLASIDLLCACLPDDVLVLPAHGRPMRAAHERLAALREEHRNALQRLHQHCRTPRRAVDVFKALFGRDIRPSELIMATGEALAHLNWLMAKNLVSVEPDANGVNWYRSN
jgi:glyoxylase-like metal-dependent hydrolase (beta-lactamase superfamily II)